MHDIKHKLKEKRINETRLLVNMYDLINSKVDTWNSLDQNYKIPSKLITCIWLILGHIPGYLYMYGTLNIQPVYMYMNA